MEETLSVANNPPFTTNVFRLIKLEEAGFLYSEWKALGA